MKVLMLSWEFPPYIDGGLGRHVAELAPALTSQGVTVHIITPHRGAAQAPEELSANLIVHRVNTETVNFETDIYIQAEQTNNLLFEAANRLWPVVGGFDLIHVHDWLVGFAALRLKVRYKCPIVATIHATEIGRWRNHSLNEGLPQAINRAEHILTYEAWRVIACSHYMVNELRQHFRLPPNKVDMIPNGINLTATFRFAAEELAAFKAQLVSPGAPLIFSVGRLVYEKGHHILIGAMPEILTTFPGARLVLAGKGPLLGYLQGIVRDLGIQDSVHFAGFITDVERDKFFSCADCAVFPSLYEPFGIVALEAMAFNCPVIVSNLGGLAEVVNHDKTGLLIYPDNSDSTAWGILQVLKKPLRAKAFAANARRVLAADYNWAFIAAETKKVYGRVLAERAAAEW